MRNALFRSVIVLPVLWIGGIAAGRFLWLQERGRIVVVYSIINTAGVQRIYMDRPHPNTREI
jgi:hypothetical protein